MESELNTTIDQWRAEMQRCITKKNDPGSTVTELSEELGLSISTIKRRLKSIIKDGRCIVGTATRFCNDIPVQVRVYRLIKEGKKK